MSRPTSSPWGKIQTCKKVAVDSYLVSTAGHGGIMVSPFVAKELHIEEFGEEYPTKDTTWICFEEDCLWAVFAVAVKLNDFVLKSDNLRLDEADRFVTALKVIARWVPEYAKKISSYPEVQAAIKSHKDDFAEIQIEKENEDKKNKLREEKSPNLIVSAVQVDNFKELNQYLGRPIKTDNFLDDPAFERDVHVWLENNFQIKVGTVESLFRHGKLVLVFTADDIRHLVTKYNYEEPFLDKCNVLASEWGG